MKTVKMYSQFSLRFKTTITEMALKAKRKIVQGIEKKIFYCAKLKERRTNITN